MSGVANRCAERKSVVVLAGRLSKQMHQGPRFHTHTSKHAEGDKEAEARARRQERYCE